MQRGSILSFLWSGLVATANFLINRTSTKANQHITPFQRVWCHRSNLSTLRIIGFVTFVRCTESHIKKLAPRAYKCILVSYDTHNTAYRCYHPPYCQILISSNLSIHEGELYFSTTTVQSHAMDTLTFSWLDLLVSIPASSEPISQPNLSVPPDDHPPLPSTIHLGSSPLDIVIPVAMLPLPTFPVASNSRTKVTTLDATSPLLVHTCTHRPLHGPPPVPFFSSLPISCHPSRCTASKMPPFNNYFLG